MNDYIKYVPLRQFSAHAEQRMQGNVINFNSYHVFDRNCKLIKCQKQQPGYNILMVQYINTIY